MFKYQNQYQPGCYININIMQWSKPCNNFSSFVVYAPYTVMIKQKAEDFACFCWHYSFSHRPRNV